MRQPCQDKAVPDWKEARRFFARLGWVSFGGPAGQIAILREELVEQVTEQIKPLMGNAAALDVPLLVEVGVGDNWDEAH